MATVPQGIPALTQRSDTRRTGETRDARYRTGPQDCIQIAGPGPEWSNKPPVVASYRQHLGHLGPIAVGAEITITARYVRVRGRFSSWQVTVCDSHEIVGEGRMDFVAVHRPRCEAARMAPEHAALTETLNTARG
jgi:hypothetical protein